MKNLIRTGRLQKRDETMRYALISDIHGRRAHLERVLADIDQHGPIDEVICLGDVFEAKIPKKHKPVLGRYAFQEVFDVDYGLLAALRNCRTLRGNQEERILEFVSLPALPQQVSDFLQQQRQSITLTNRVVLEHGHRFDWVEREPGYWCPVVTDEPKTVIYGHNHQNVLFRADASAGTPDYHRVPIKYGSPVYIGDARYLVNVGDVKRSEPSWVLFDSDEESITYFQLRG